MRKIRASRRPDMIREYTGKKIESTFEPEQ